MRRLGLNLLVLCVTSLLVIVLLEVVLRVAYPVAFQHYIPVSAIDMSTPIKRFKPNIVFEVVRPDFHVQIASNSRGFRDREHDFKSHGKHYRILGLGDSFTFGFGVPLEQTYLRILEKELNRSTQDIKAEVIKAGMISYTTKDELAYFQLEGVKYNPALVVLGFFLGNDFIDNLPRQSSLRKEIDAAAGWSSWPYRFKVFLNTNSALYGFTIDRVKSNHHLTRFFVSWGLIAPPPMPKFIYQSKKKESLKIAEAKRLTRNYLAALNRAVSVSGAKLLVMIIPAKEQAYEKLWQKAVRQFGLDSSHYDPYKPVRDMLYICEDIGLHCLNLYPTLETGAKGGVEFYYRKDGHFNTEGHKVAAEELLKFINKFSSVAKGNRGTLPSTKHKSDSDLMARP